MKNNTSIKVYKFRPASQLVYILDILINSRLYCSDWRKLNDPMEGHFKYDNDIETRKIIDDFFVPEKAKNKICSFSKIYKNPLLWSHYADGHNGVAIQIRFPQSNVNLKKVFYTQNHIGLNVKAIHKKGTTARMARFILQNKLKDWEYEKEYRLLYDREYFYCKDESVKITKILIGCRTSEVIQKTLEIICKEKGIRVVKLNDKLEKC